MMAGMTQQSGLNDSDGEQERHEAGESSNARPAAKRVPHERRLHGDVFNDPYEWMRDKAAGDVRDYVAAQNTYCQARTAHLAGLSSTLFSELKSHVQETDMSVPTRMNDYWYFGRTQQGSQYGAQCRIPVRGVDDWDPPVVYPEDAPGAMPGEQIVFDANKESEGHDFFRLDGMDLSRDGRWLLYGVDTTGDERYDFHIRDLNDGTELPEVLRGIGGACFTPDGHWVFYVALDDAWRPFAVRRHHMGEPVGSDREVFREVDERFWVGVSVSFDECNVVISTGSKTTSEVLLLPVGTPEGEFRTFIPREDGVEYDVSFSRFEAAGEQGEDIPIAVVYHNALNPNFQIDVIDMRRHEPPFRLGEGICVAVGSPCGCERGDDVEVGASGKPVHTAYRNPCNPEILQGASGLGIEGMAIHRHFVSLAYRAGSLPHVAYMTKGEAAEDFLAGQPWRFKELVPPELEGEREESDEMDMTAEAAMLGWADEPGIVAAKAVLKPGRRLYSIGTGGNPSYDAPRMRYSFASYARPGELHELDPATGTDALLKRAEVLGGFDPHTYAERRVWVAARDGERIPVSLVWKKGTRPACGAMPMFITGYGAYEISSDPGFSVARLSLLDRGVLYAVLHIRGGGEMGRAWYEQGRRLRKKHTFEDFVDATIALQNAGLADARRTVANGGSAGGLLMGAVANMAPERYAGIEADVPFVDALTSMLDPTLPLTVTEWDEWGDPLHSEAAYRYMKSYTPYENAPCDERPVEYFPRILITTSMNDTRVLYVEPLKWLARLQSAGVDAIAKIEVEAGHGGISGRYKQWEEVSYENAWCLDVLMG